MTYLGTVKDGLIELQEGTTLPDGTLVRIEPLEVGSDPADGLGDEAAPSGLNDLAAHHDHYVYGVPKTPE